MNNYEHEITCPDNKGIRNYLWYDHFHDSNIVDISFNHRKGLAVMALESCRDIDNMWDKLKGDFDVRRAYIDENIDSFTYILTFKRAKYFHSERLVMGDDYINGRFKDTAMLKKLIAENKKQLYHFRIQTNDGFIDVIFSDFTIKKKAGRVKYPINEIIRQTNKRFTEDAIKTALNGDDFGRFLAMRELYQENDPMLLDIARKNLWFDDDGDACLYSAYLLGKLGDTNDIPNLLEIYLKIEERPVFRYNAVQPKRIVLDAIELIHYRDH